MADLLRTLLYALLAAASPLALTATVVVLESGRARLNGVIFAIAFLTTTSFVVGLVLIVGSFTVPGGGHDIATAVAELCLGAALVGWAAHLRRRPAGDAAPATPVHPLLERMGRLTPPTALAAGALLGVGGPKRLTITVIAAGSISAADVAYDAQLGLAAAYGVVASVLVWGPVLAYVLAGAGARTLLEGMQAWLVARRHVLATWSLGALGIALVLDAVVRLAS